MTNIECAHQQEVKRVEVDERILERILELADDALCPRGYKNKGERLMRIAGLVEAALNGDRMRDRRANGKS